MTEAESTPKRKYTEGHEWSNHRRQVFVYLPNHHLARKDGFVARAKIIVELVEDRKLDPNERVLHLNGVPWDDEPENLMVFPNIAALNQYRSERHREEQGEMMAKRLKEYSDSAKELRKKRQTQMQKVHEEMRRRNKK